MEKLKEQICIPCSIGWSDVGSWDELARLADEVGALKTDSATSVFLEDSSNNYVFSIKNKVVGLIGVDNLIVVDTPDAVLVCKKGQSQKVKDLLNQIRSAGLPEAVEHQFEIRPWGGFEILADQKEFKAKRITVDPGAKLSYQSHVKRNEHWVVVSGKAEVVKDDEVLHLEAGQSIYIPAGAKHRIGNIGSLPMIFVEVQTGSYFGEDDIVRYQDDYSRV
ncbi:MAG: cupin domain-containing protein [Bdellovibrionales bacterium]|nr:cupin domain-containing protein [Bdellovibrionales bacterium]